MYMYCRVCVSHHCIVYTYFLECVFPPALCDAGNPDALTRSGLSSTKGKIKEKSKQQHKSQPDTQNVADIVFIIYISLTKKVRRNPFKSKGGNAVAALFRRCDYKFCIVSKCIPLK